MCLLLLLNDGIRDEQTHSLILDSLFHDGGKTRGYRRDSLSITRLVRWRERGRRKQAVVRDIYCTRKR